MLVNLTILKFVPQLAQDLSESPERRQVERCPGLGVPPDPLADSRLNASCLLLPTSSWLSVAPSQTLSHLAGLTTSPASTMAIVSRKSSSLRSA